MVVVHPALPPLPIRPEAWEWLQRSGVRVVVRDPTSRRGGGYWWPDRKLVDLFTAQEEAAIHELAHAWWHERRLQGTNAADLMVACVKLSEEKHPRYARARELARHYVYGIPTQPDPQSPTGWWMGMFVGGNGGGLDWEVYAGLASGVMGNLALLPPYIRRFYEELFDPPVRDLPPAEEIALRDGRRVAVRLADPDDAAAIWRLIDTVARERRYLRMPAADWGVEGEWRWLVGLEERGGFMLVAWDGDRAVGWVDIVPAAGLSRHTGELGMGVHPDYRGVGLGTALLARALDRARALGLEKITLGVRAPNAVARHLYERFGFVVEGEFSGQIKDGAVYENEVRMALWLGDRPPLV